MKKSIQYIAITLSIALLMACSNSDKKSSSYNPTGTAVFFHYVTGVSTLKLESESNDRGLGTVNFEKFASGIILNAKNWDLTVTDIRNESDSGDDVPVLEDVSFNVIKDRKTIHALIGDVADTLELVDLEMAYDEEAGDVDNDGNGVRDDKKRFINFSSIYPQDSLNVYLVSPAYASTPISDLNVAATADPENVYKQVVGFKESTAAIKLIENSSRYYLRIARADTPNTEIFNSGERSISDYLQQTIIIAPYTGSVDTGSQVTAFYYYGEVTSQKWSNSDSKGQVRVFNAFPESVDLNFELTNTDPLATSPMVNFHQGFNNLSSFEVINTRFVAYSVIFDEAGDNSYFASILEPVVNVEDGQSWTIIPFGRLSDDPMTPYIIESPTAVAVLEEDTSFSNKATITVSNAGYIADENYRKPYNVHITTPNEPVVNPSSTSTGSVDIPALGYGDYGVATVNAGLTYKISITSTEGTVVNNKAAPVSVSVQGGENMHFVFMEKVGGGFQIVRLIGDASATRTLINVSNNAVTTGDSVTITIQAKDVGGNRLEVGGDTVILETTGGAVITPLTATDNSNGTYTASITSATAETVTISGTINGIDITDTAKVVFSAP